MHTLLTTAVTEQQLTTTGSVDNEIHSCHAPCADNSITIRSVTPSSDFGKEIFCVGHQAALTDIFGC